MTELAPMEMSSLALGDVCTPKSPWLPRFLRSRYRKAWRWLTSAHYELVYHDQYNSAFPNIPNDPLRPERLLAFLASEGLILRRCVHTPRPVQLNVLAQIHSADYLDRVHDLDVLRSIMGIDVTPDQVDRLLDLQRLMTGGTLLATRLAQKKGFAVNLGGGFHHALAHQGGGFCLWNDVAVAIAEERRRGFDGRVLVVDLDLHDGDGTRDIFAEDETVHTFSIHARDWGPTEAVASTAIELGREVGDDLYLSTLEEHLPKLFADFKPQLVIYLAGTDPAREDQLGEWQITPRGMLARDVRVARLARESERKVPFVVLLAGGYSYEAWRYTARFLSDPFCRRGPIEPPSTEEMTLKRYRYLASLMNPNELSGASTDNDFGLTEEDLMLPGWAAQKETRFLGYYTRHGIELVLERAGILGRLRDLGYSHPVIEFELDNPAGHTIRTYADPSREEVLMEMRLHKDRRTIPGRTLLSIEWLLLQNPRTSFGPSRRKLPGQKYPGLGMLNDVVALLAVACDRLHLDGLVCVPSEYHIAVQWHGRMHFLKREAQARFEALWNLLHDVPLAKATRAVAEGRVVDEATGEPFKWHPEPMIAPTSGELAESFEPHEVSEEQERYTLRLLQEG